MRIALGSKSEKKYNALKSALDIMNIECDIDCYKVSSDVADNPVNEEILEGAYNRNNNVIKIDNSYDMYVSIEAGFTKSEEEYYVDSYCVVRYKDKDFVGMSPRLRISSKVFNYVSTGNVLHLLIQELQGSNTDDGVVGFLSSGKLKRSEIETYCIIDALEKALDKKSNYKMINVDDYLDQEQIDRLDREIDKRINSD